MSSTGWCPRVAVAFFGLATAGLCLASLLTNEWYTISAPSSTTVKDASYGLYKSCVDGSCATNSFKDFVLTGAGGCTRAGKDMEKRTYAVFGLVIGGGAVGLITMLLMLISRNRRIVTLAGIVGSFLSMGACVAAAVLYPFTWHLFYFCDKSYCQTVTTGTCEAFFGYSYALEIIGAASSVVGFVISVLIGCKFLPPAAQGPAASAAHVEAASGEQGKSASASAGSQAAAAVATGVPSTTSTQAASGGDQRPVDHHTQPADSRSGTSNERRANEMRALTTSTTNNQSLDGWELDENTGLYWSDREKLFYDPISGHFYDPESELWYDPSTEQWYQGAEQ